MEISEHDLEDFVGGKIIIEDFGYNPNFKKGKILGVSLDRGVITLTYEINEKVKNINTPPEKKNIEILLESYQYSLCPGDKVIEFTSTFIDSKTITLAYSTEKFQTVETL
jgi:hypothetical protein